MAAVIVVDDGGEAEEDERDGSRERVFMWEGIEQCHHSLFGSIAYMASVPSPINKFLFPEKEARSQ